MRRPFLQNIHPFLSCLLAVLFTDCTKVCDKDSLPQYTLTAEERKWANPYAEGSVWRFRNTAGYERRYLVKEFRDEMASGGGSKGSFCPSYYHQQVNARFERTDSLQTTGHQLSMSTAANYQTAPFGASLTWAGSEFGLPITEVEQGMAPLNIGNVSSARVLPQVTVSGRVYPNVLECSLTPFAHATNAPSTVLRIFVTKADGIIRFETKAGTAWDRI